MTVFILDSLLHDSTEHEYFVHYQISRVKNNAWYMAGTE